MNFAKINGEFPVKCNDISVVHLCKKDKSCGNSLKLTWRY